MFWKLVGFFASLCLLALVGPAVAQPAAVTAKSPLGLAIASKTPSLNWYEKRDGQLVCVGTVAPLDLLAISEEADYYQVRWLARQGWVKRDDVVALSKGIAYFKGRVERDPSDGYAQCLYAYELLVARQPAQVQSAADEAGRLLPNDSRPRLIRARLLLFKRDEKGALDDLSVAARIDPSNSQIYLDRAGITGIIQSQYDEALLDHDKASRVSPNYEVISLARSRIWAQRGDYRKGAAELDKAIQAYPDFLAAHVERAELLSLFIDPAVYSLQEAVVSARRACELTAWENSTHLRRLALLCERLGYKEEAVRCREKADRADTAQLPPLPAAKP